MAQTLWKTTALSIEANTSPCAHICRYCSIGDRGPKFSLEQWMTFVERFYDWRQNQGPDAPRIQGGFIGPSYNFDVDTLSLMSDWNEKIHGGRLRCLPLGGLKMRSSSEMRQWLMDRQAIGVDGVHASFVGVGAVHDRWNGRHGDFDFLVQTLRTASELGMNHSTNLYLTKSSLPHLETLASILDALPTPHSGRYVRPFYYVGHAAHHPNERLTEEDCEKLPAFVHQALKGRWELRSEREWIDIILAETEERVQELYLRLELTHENFEELETQSCDDIFDKLEACARATLSVFPSFQELAAIHGDKQNTGLYMFRGDLYRQWQQRFLDSHPTHFDRSVLHYQLGRSLNPPNLWNKLDSLAIV